MFTKQQRILAFIVLLLGLLAFSKGKAQLVQKGNNFSIVQNDSTKNGGITRTKYTYTDVKGVTDTIYLSRSGSAFIFKVSKKTGKVYRKYLPEVTARLKSKKQ